MSSEYRPPHRFEPPRTVEVFSNGQWRRGSQDMWHWDWFNDRWLAHVTWYEVGLSGVASLPADQVRLPEGDATAGAPEQASRVIRGGPVPLRNPWD